MSSAYVMLSQLRGLEERLEGVKGSLQAGPDSRDVEPSRREDHEGILLRALAQRDGGLCQALQRNSCLFWVENVPLESEDPLRVPLAWRPRESTHRRGWEAYTTGGGAEEACPWLEGAHAEGDAPALILCDAFVQKDEKVMLSRGVRAERVARTELGVAQGEELWPWVAAGEAEAPTHLIGVIHWVETVWNDMFRPDVFPAAPEEGDEGSSDEGSDSSSSASGGMPEEEDGTQQWFVWVPVDGPPSARALFVEKDDLDEARALFEYTGGDVLRPVVNSIFRVRPAAPQGEEGDGGEIPFLQGQSFVAPLGGPASLFLGFMARWLHRLGNGGASLVHTVREQGFALVEAEGVECWLCGDTAVDGLLMFAMAVQAFLSCFVVDPAGISVDAGLLRSLRPFSACARESPSWVELVEEPTGFVKTTVMGTMVCGRVVREACALGAPKE